MTNYSLNQSKDILRPIGQGIASYFKEQSDFSPEEMSILFEANSITSNELDQELRDNLGSWTLVGQKQLMPALNTFCNYSIGNPMSIVHPLLMAIPEAIGQIPNTSVDELKLSFNFSGYHAPMMTGKALPVLIDKEYYQSCKTFNISNVEGAHDLLNPAVGVPFNFYLPAGCADALNTIMPNPNFEVGDCLATIKFGSAARWISGDQELQRAGTEGLPHEYIYKVIRAFIINVQKLDNQLSSKLAYRLASSAHIDIEDLQSLSRVEREAVLMLGGAKSFIETHAVSLPNDAYPVTEDSLCAYISLLGVDRNTNQVFGFHICESIETLMQGPTDEYDSVGRVLMNMIMVEIATSGCFKTLTHEHSLGKSEALTSKRKKKKLQAKQRIKGAFATASIPIKRYGQDSVLTLRTDSSTKEWKGSRLLRPHWRRPHMATRLKGKGPDKRKEQVLVKGSLVTGEGARLQRMKRAALNRDTSGSQMLDN